MIPILEVVREVNWSDAIRIDWAYLDSLFVTTPDGPHRKVSLEKLAGPKMYWRSWFDKADESDLLKFAEIAFDNRALTG